MFDLGYFFGQVLMVLLPAAVLAVGLALLAIRRDRLPRRAAKFTVAGSVVLLAGMLASVLWSLVLPALMHSGPSPAAIGGLGALVGMLLSLFNATGLALLIGGILARANQPAAPSPSAAQSVRGHL